MSSKATQMSSKGTQNIMIIMLTKNDNIMITMKTNMITQ